MHVERCGVEVEWGGACGEVWCGCTYIGFILCLLAEEPVALLDEVLHDLTLVGHVVHHVGHVVLRGAHQRGPEHNGQVARLHLDR